MLIACFTAFTLGGWSAQPAETSPMTDVIPRTAGSYAAEGSPERYDRQTVYDYMDGGAEVYLAYGVKALWAQAYVKKGEPPVTLNLFEMDSAAGAFGVFTYEREDEEAGIGQGSEYGGGILRFWQGRSFVFVQAESETPESKQAVLALGKALVPRLGAAQPPPDLPATLPADGLRPLSLRYVLSPLLLEAFERAAIGNPLGLPPSCEAVLGRYGPKGGAERVLLARFPGERAAQKGVESFLAARAPAAAKAGEPYRTEHEWNLAQAWQGCAVLVLGAPDEEAARRRLAQALDKLKEEPR